MLELAFAFVYAHVANYTHLIQGKDQFCISDCSNPPSLENMQKRLSYFLLSAPGTQLENEILLLLIIIEGRVSIAEATGEVAAINDRSINQSLF